MNEIQKSIIQGSNLFGYDLSNELPKDTDNKNIWISPFCISSCFSLIYPGSDGNTAVEIANVMGYPTSSPSDEVAIQTIDLESSILDTYSSDKSGDSPIVLISNKIYVSYDISLQQDFIDTLNFNTDNGTFIEYDFNFAADDAPTIINDWVRGSTLGKIDKIVEDDISDVKLMALNAIYVKAQWESVFEEANTQKAPFYAAPVGNNIIGAVNLMYQDGYFPYYEDGNYQYLELRFSDSSMFVLFALPFTTDAVTLTSTSINHVLDNLQDKNVNIWLPKMKIEEKYFLGEPLQNMGMIDTFSELANFKQMTVGGGLYISRVIHKAMIELDETGVIAAAVTEIDFEDEDEYIPDEEEKIEFRADHPFQMFIIDGAYDNLILFMGEIDDPGFDSSVDMTELENSERYTYQEGKAENELVENINNGRIGNLFDMGELRNRGQHDPYIQQMAMEQDEVNENEGVMTMDFTSIVAVLIVMMFCGLTMCCCVSDAKTIK